MEVSLTIVDADQSCFCCRLIGAPVLKGVVMNVEMARTSSQRLSKENAMIDRAQYVAEMPSWHKS